MKFIITISISLLLTLSINAQNDSVLYSFFVAGHTYGKPGVDNEGFHPPFKSKFEYIQNRDEIKFGVLTGDIVAPNPTAQDWDEIDSEIDTLGLDVYFAVGNHDMENRPLFESRYGITYYKFIYQNDLFVVLDPNIDGWRISGEQMEFLQGVLNEDSQITDNIYVFFHQILWKETGSEYNYPKFNSDAGMGDDLNFWSEVVPAFRDIPNKVVMFAGDYGASWASDATYDIHYNITFIGSGMGHEDGENFIVANVNMDKSINYDLICLSDTNPNCLGELTDLLVVNQVSMPTVDLSVNAVVYPNPATDKITISHNSDINGSVKLFNIQGALVLEREYQYNSPELTVNVNNVPNGIYLLRINEEGNQYSVKVIIE